MKTKNEENERLKQKFLKILIKKRGKKYVDYGNIVY